jgi:hypothetical protein
MTPWVDRSRTQLIKVSLVPRYDYKIMHQSRRCNECVPLWPRIGNVEGS